MAAILYLSAGNFTARLTVMDNSGATGSSIVSITVTASTLNAPTNLSGKASGTTVTLNWIDKSTNEEGFYIERTLKNSSSWTRVGTVGANVKTFSQTVTRNTYLFRVQAFNNALGKVSAYSNQVQVRVK